MENIRLLAAVALSLVSVAAAADDGTGCEWYVQGAAQIVLPQGGARMRRLGGGAARVFSALFVPLRGSRAQ